MGLLNFGKRLGKGALSGAGKGITKVGSSRGALAAIGIGALGMGIASEVGPAARDAALDFSMGDPNADVAFTGSKFSARYLAGTAIGGGIGGAMRASAPGDYFRENPMFMPGNSGRFNPVGGAIGGAAGGGLGVLAGGIAGGVLGGKKGEVIGGILGGVLGGGAGFTAGAGGGSLSPEALVGGTGVAGIVGGAVGLGVGGTLSGGVAEDIFKLGNFGRRASKTVGGLYGGAIGMGLGMAAVGAIAAHPVLDYTKKNQQFFNESPYAPRSSMATSSALNASGDIVLGMHNSRRGY